uniref:Septin 9 n=1 Tax=Ailuropoda melanoleuca TaxID=9646 RepID=A0A7N5KJY8_AILME
MERDRITALKRSFEVEEAETPNSTPHRRVQTPVLRATVASSTQKFQDLGVKNPEPAARHVDSLSQRSPKAALRRVELSGPKTEPVSRRTEISIDISSKQVENASAPGPSRFGLKRAEALGHKTPEPAPRRTEITIVKPQESAHRRMETPASKIPEVPAAPTADVAPKRVEIQVPKPAEVPASPIPPQTLENSEHALMSQLQSRLEPKPQPPVVEAPPKSQEAPEAAPGCTGDMADTPRDAGLKQVPAPRNEKAPADFGYVGIDSILEQMRRKAMKQGFEFNIMVVGQSGLGKSTLINTLFKSKISRKSVQPTSEERIPKTIEIKSITHDIEEKGVRMKLTVIDTPGFGDHINNENCLRPLDIEFMKRLSKVVNIVPVIAKADTLTLEERVYFKQRITADLLSNDIDVYPQKEFDEDSEDRLVNEKFREMIPFAVVGSDHEYQVNGKRILGRKTKWGTIEVENTTHCEFAYLRDLLIRLGRGMWLLEVTHCVSLETDAHAEHQGHHQQHPLRSLPREAAARGQCCVQRRRGEGARGSGDVDPPCPRDPAPSPSQHHPQASPHAPFYFILYNFLHLSSFRPFTRLQVTRSHAPS